MHMQDRWTSWWLMNLGIYLCVHLLPEVLNAVNSSTSSTDIPIQKKTVFFSNNQST